MEDELGRIAWAGVRRNASVSPPPDGWTAAEEDNVRTINIVCWLSVGVSLLFLVLRLYCKYLTRRWIWWDDYILILAWVSRPPTTVPL